MVPYLFRQFYDVKKHLSAEEVETSDVFINVYTPFVEGSETV